MESDPIHLDPLGSPLAKVTEERDPMMQFFSHSHLQPRLQEVSRPFGELAEHVATLPRNEERSTAFRKLLEAKDAAVRAALASRRSIDGTASRSRKDGRRAMTPTIGVCIVVFLATVGLCQRLLRFAWDSLDRFIEPMIEKLLPAPMDDLPDFETWEERMP